MHGMAWHVLEGVTAVTVFQYGDFPVWFGIDSKIFKIISLSNQNDLTLLETIFVLLTSHTTNQGEML